jgi:hypothetical protein
MKSVVKDGYWGFTTRYVDYNNCNENFLSYIEGLEYDLLKVVLEQMNITFVHVPHQKDLKMWNGR